MRKCRFVLRLPGPAQGLPLRVGQGRQDVGVGVKGGDMRIVDPFVIDQVIHRRRDAEPRQVAHLSGRPAESGSVQQVPCRRLVKTGVGDGIERPIHHDLPFRSGRRRENSSAFSFQRLGRDIIA